MILYNFTLQYGLNGGSFSAPYYIPSEAAAQSIAEQMMSDINTGNFEFTEDGYSKFMGIESYSIDSKDTSDMTSYEADEAFTILAPMKNTGHIIDKLLDQL